MNSGEHAYWAENHYFYDVGKVNFNSVKLQFEKKGFEQTLAICSIATTIPSLLCVVLEQQSRNLILFYFELYVPIFYCFRQLLPLHPKNEIHLQENT